MLREEAHGVVCRDLEGGDQGADEDAQVAGGLEQGLQAVLVSLRPQDGDDFEMEVRTEIIPGAGNGWRHLNI